ncbi:MAG TPA: DUF3455 domain-containing protein [Rhodopila sp.]
MRHTVLPGAVFVAMALLASVTAQAADTAIELHGKGVQVYACTQADTGFAWHLTGPDALLTDAAGRVVGHHFAGPSWQAKDGSTIVGESLVSSAAPKPGAVPWLVLRVKSHSGSGALASVAYVVRSHTVGGVAPATGCDQAHAGAESRVPYTATYTFFPGAESPAK